MFVEANTAAINGLLAVWNGSKAGAVADYVAASYVRHDPAWPTAVRGPEGVAQLIGLYRAAFPDLHFTPEVMLAGGDQVAALWRVRGTHLGALMGLAPTGRTVTLTAADFYRLRDGKIVEQWVQLDSLGLLRQLGVVPGPGSAEGEGDGEGGRPPPRRRLSKWVEALR